MTTKKTVDAKVIRKDTNSKVFVKDSKFELDLESSPITFEVNDLVIILGKFPGYDHVFVCLGPNGISWLPRGSFEFCNETK